MGFLARKSYSFSNSIHLSTDGHPDVSSPGPLNSVGVVTAATVTGVTDTVGRVTFLVLVGAVVVTLDLEIPV